MRTLFSVRTLLLMSSLLLTSVADAEDFFPLYPGNSWTYRADTGEAFQITVGLNPIVTLDGRVYHRVRGYATNPLLVRSGADGQLYWLNEATQQDEILTNFRPFAGGFYTTPISDPCEQDAQAQEDPVVFQLGGMLFSAARQIRYRIYSCADTGVAEELYLENIGLVRRTVQTIVGPRSFTLVSANVGPFRLNETPGVEFRVSLSHPVVLRRDPREPVETTVTLRLVADRTEPVLLRFRSSQRYDIAVKNEQGETVHLWSSAVLFLQVLGKKVLTSKEYSEPLSLNLPDGRYLVEAWLTTDSDSRQFASAATLWVQSGQSGVRCSGARPSKPQSEKGATPAL